MLASYTEMAVMRIEGILERMPEPIGAIYVGKEYTIRAMRSDLKKVLEVLRHQLGDA